MSEHLARHVLERLVADDLRDPVAPAARVHAASCDQCAVGRRAIETARAQYLTSHPAERFAAVVHERSQRALPVTPHASRWRKLRWPATALAVACAAALVALVARPDLVAPLRAAIRFRDAPATLQTYLRRGNQTRVLRAGEALHAGDQLAFSYSLRQPQHCLLLGIDDAGSIARYFPETTLAPAAILPAGAGQLPIGIELDARKGQERLVAFFSATALDEQRARQALHDRFVAARTRGAGVAELDALDLPGYQVSVWFQKP